MVTWSRIGVWQAIAQVVGCFVQARRVVMLHARGEIDDLQAQALLQAIEARVQVLRRRHTVVDVVVELLGHPGLVSRPVLLLVALAGVLSLLAWRR